MCLAVAELTGNCQGQLQQVKPGTEFESPGGAFVAKCAASDGGLIPTVEQITIINKNVACAYAPIEINQPLYSVAWTGDSKTLVLIEHTAGGTFARFVHRNDGQWKDHTVDAGEGDKSSVVRQTLHNESFELAYRVHVMPTSRTAERFYLYSFEVDPETNQRRNEKRETIDVDSYIKLQLKTERPQ